MIKRTWVLLAFIGALFFGQVSPISAQVATKVRWYFYPCSLPNEAVAADFAKARDQIFAGLKEGGNIVTGSRLQKPSAVEIRTVFDTGDISVSTSGPIWRGVFNPPAPFDQQKGQRIYCPVMVVGENGKISLDRLGWRVSCEIGGYNTNSTLGANYHYSRVGIYAGPDGKLFTADDTTTTINLSGANLVDAIIYIGARMGVTVNSPSEFQQVDADFEGYYGKYVSFAYEYAGPEGTQYGTCRVRVCRKGQIPSGFNSVLPTIGPKGVLWSIVGTDTMNPLPMSVANKVTGPYTVEKTMCVSGDSIFLPFKSGTSSSDCGFVRLAYPY